MSTYFRKSMSSFARRMFPIGTRVRTLKGSRKAQPFSGRITKHSFWRNYPAVTVQKDNGRKVRCLVTNLEIESTSRVTHR